MNIKIDIDMTPEEVRRLMGLPDVQAFNEKVMEDMMERMNQGLEGYDPMSIFQASIMNNGELSKRWMDMFAQFGSMQTNSDKKS